MSMRHTWVIPVLLVVAACGSSSSSAGSGTLRVEGTLEEVGGPAGASNDKVPGDISLVSDSGNRYSVKAKSDGSFTANVTPGTYTVTGTSPQFNGGKGTCLAESPLVVADAQVGASVKVICPRK